MGRPPEHRIFATLPSNLISATYRHFDGKLAKLQWQLANMTQKHSFRLHPQEIAQAMRGIALKDDKIKLIKALLTDLGIAPTQQDEDEPCAFPVRHNQSPAKASLTLEQINVIYREFKSIVHAYNTLAPLTHGQVGRILFYDMVAGKRVPQYKVDLVTTALAQHAQWKGESNVDSQLHP